MAVAKIGNQRHVDEEVETRPAGLTRAANTAQHPRRMGERE